MRQSYSLTEIEHMLNTCMSIKRKYPEMLTHSAVREVEDCLAIWVDIDRACISDVIRAFEKVYRIYYNLMFLMVRDNK